VLIVYALVQSKTCKLYIGKAEREDGDASLYIRLCEHVKTIMKVTNLSLADFTFHCLVLPLERVAYAEANLIRLYRPAWNSYLKGFGLRAKDRNGEHRDQGWATRVSLFNTYHPGRELAAKAVPRDHAEVERGLQEAVRISRERYDAVQVLLYPTGTNEALDDLFSLLATAKSPEPLRGDRVEAVPRADDAPRDRGGRVRVSSEVDRIEHGDLVGAAGS
jgi:hypothetical protein